MDWLSGLWASLTLGKILLGIGLFLLSLSFSFVSIGVVMVKIPENYFSSHYQQDFMPNSRWIVRWGVVILKNVCGVFLIFNWHRGAYDSWTRTGTINDSARFDND